jgi:hypothetical protein
MVEFCHYLLIGICLLIVIWAMIKVERIYQFPFFMASMVITFILPQVSALINHPGPVTENMLIQVLIMTCLCITMCWVGYNSAPNRKLLYKLQIPLDDKKLLNAAIFLTAMGWVFGILTGQAASTLQQGAQWTGPATIFAFFSGVIYIGFPIFLLQLLKKPSAINITGTIIAAFPIIQTVLAGRRQATMTFLIIIGLCIWFVLKLAPPRLLIVVALIAGVYIIPLVGQLRGGFWNLVFQQDWQTLKDTAESSFDTLQAGKTLELRNAALVIDWATSSDKYEYGAGYWNAFVFQYIPGQILGYDFKESIQFSLQREANISSYGYSFPLGSTWTGIGDSYLQFGYFGCLIFALMGVLFKTLWVSSVYHRSIVATLLMMSLISPAMLGITHGTARFLQELIFQVIVITLVAYYARFTFKSRIISDF